MFESPALSEVPKEQKETKNEYLPPKDRQVLENGFDDLWIWLSEKEPDQLPRKIIFPDTGARPLAIAVKYELDLLYAKKGQPAPTYHFFAMSREQFRSDEQPIKRLKQILGDEDSPNILIVDDYFAFGETADNFDKIYQKATGSKEERPKNINYFSFFTNDEEGSNEAGELAPMNDAYMEKIGKDRLRTGTSHTKNWLERNNDESNSLYPGFRYRSTEIAYQSLNRDANGKITYKAPKIDYTKDARPQEKLIQSRIVPGEAFIGVKKDGFNQTVSRNPFAEHEHMIGLRNQILDIAKQVVEQKRLETN